MDKEFCGVCGNVLEKGTTIVLTPDGDIHPQCAERTPGEVAYKAMADELKNLRAIKKAVGALLVATTPLGCPRCSDTDEEIFKPATKRCLDAADDSYYACDEHARPGGMDGDDGPWDLPGAKERAALIALLEEK